jgi:recombinational DNA repair protein RecR
MSRRGEGNQWQAKGFSVFMHNTDKKENRCLRCRNYKGTTKCKVCKFDDRGWILIDKRF